MRTIGKHGLGVHKTRRGPRAAPWIAAGLMVAVTCVVPAVAEEDQTIVPPPGDYRMVEVVLEKIQEKDNRSRGGSIIDGNLVLRGGIRDGKLRIPSVLSVRDITGELVFTTGEVKGAFTYQAPRSFTAVRFTVAGRIAGGRITGTYRDQAGKRTGKVSGSVKAEAVLAKENAFTGGKDWPCWSGPFTSMEAAHCGLALLDDFAQAKPVWRSEELVPHGPGNALNYHNLAVRDRTMGGGASVVVADGKVFVNYFQPAGTELMKIVSRDYNPGGPAETYLDMLAKKDNLTITPFMREKFLVKADDVIVCMDAATGKTLWKNVFAGQSLNQPNHKGGVVNNTPCVGDGRVFAMGPGGNLYAMQTKTGKVLWKRSGMSAERVRPWSGARNMCTAPVYVGGVLVLPDHASTLYGIDPDTGKDLWKLEGKGNSLAVPCKWVCQGREYVIQLAGPGWARNSAGKNEQTPQHVFCIEPRTGKTLWKIELGRYCGKGVSVFGDTMAGLVGLRGKTSELPDAQCVAFRLTPTKAEQIWSVSCPYITDHMVPAINERYVVLAGVSESRMLDAATGRELAKYTGPGPFNEGHVMLAEDRVFLSCDGSHGHSEMVILGGTPETFGTPLATWSQPHPQTTSYHNKYMTWPVVEGRLFMRGYDGVYCYDLRKK